jgi:hypothetical protein
MQSQVTIILILAWLCMHVAYPFMAMNHRSRNLSSAEKPPKKIGKRYFVAFSDFQTTGERKEFPVVPQNNDPGVEPLYVPQDTPTWLSPTHKSTA